MDTYSYKKGDRQSKKMQVQDMFNRISGVYDMINHVLSVGIDIIWRKKAIRLLKPFAPTHLLDVATGTADFAIEALALNPDKITGVDISEGMLQVGRQKLKKKKLDHKIELIKGDSEKLLFEENKFDGVIVAFGVRNFEKLEYGLAEMLRVTKPGGKIAILEFSKPRLFLFKQLYNVYCRCVLPWVGRWVSRDKIAYNYLPKSVQAFPDGKNFVVILTRLGYKNVICKPFTLGISSLYLAVK